MKRLAEWKASLQRVFTLYSKLTLFMLFGGSLIVSVILFITIFASFLSPFSPIETSRSTLVPPCSEHPFGTDGVGRDVFSRVLYGGRTSLSIGFIACLMSFAMGVPLGLISGFFGGKIDRLVALVMDTLYAFPVYLTALMFAIILGPEVQNISMAVGIAYIPQYFRVMRSIALSIREKTFIKVEKSIGAGNIFIIHHHILPFCVSSLTVMLSMGIADAIIMVSGLGFLGLGIKPPTPEWGTDLRWGHNVLLAGKWWVGVFPGLMISLTIIGFNMFTEGLNAVFQEREKFGR